MPETIIPPLPFASVPSLQTALLFCAAVCLALASLLAEPQRNGVSAPLPAATALPPCRQRRSWAAPSAQGCSYAWWRNA